MNDWKSRNRIYRALRDGDLASLLGEMALAEIADSIATISPPLAKLTIDDAATYARMAWHEARAMKPKQRESILIRRGVERDRARAESTARACSSVGSMTQVQAVS
jgi:hypothetical protein